MLLSFFGPRLHHWADRPEVAVVAAPQGVVWARYMGYCKGPSLAPTLKDNQPYCNQGELADDNYFITVPFDVENKGLRGGHVTDLSLVLKTPHQEYSFEPYQLERKTKDGLEVAGHLPSRLAIGPETSETYLVGFRSSLVEGEKLVFTKEDSGPATLLIHAKSENGKVFEQSLDFDFVGYIRTTGFVGWEAK